MIFRVYKEALPSATRCGVRFKGPVDPQRTMDRVVGGGDGAQKHHLEPVRGDLLEGG